MAKEDIPYAYRRDIPWNLSLTQDGDLDMQLDVDAVNQSIYSILVSNSGDKPLEPLFGSNVESILFDQSLPLNIIAFELKEKLKSSIADIEPSVIPLSIDIDGSDINDHILRVTVEYLLSDGITTGVFDESLSIEDLKR